MTDTEIVADLVSQTRRLVRAHNLSTAERIEADLISTGASAIDAERDAARLFELEQRRLDEATPRISAEVASFVREAARRR